VTADVAIALTVGMTATFLTGCTAPPQEREAPLTAAATDSAWQWVYVPEEYQCTYGTGLAVAERSVLITGFYSRGFYHDCPDPRWGGQLLELHGETNIFIARHDVNGTLRWARRYGDDGRIAPTDIAIGPNGSLYVAAAMTPSIVASGLARWDTGGGAVIATKETAVVARFDSAGTLEWVRTIDGAEDVRDVAVDRQGIVYVAGNSVTEVRTSQPTGGPELPDSSDAYVAAYSPNGDRRWFRVLARGGHARAESVSPTPYGICVAGSFDVPDVIVYEGETRRFGVGHGFAVGLSPRGQRLWTDTVPPRHRDPAKPERSIGGGPLGIGIALEATAAGEDGACYAAGGFAGVMHFGRDTLTSVPHPDGAPPRGYTDAMILKYDRRGKRQWAQRGVGGPSSEYVAAVAVAPDERVVVAGTFSGSGEFGDVRLVLPEREPSTETGRWVGGPHGVFVAALSAGGDVLHVVQNVPDEAMSITDVAVLADGRVYLTGEQQRSAMYGAIEAKTAGENAFLAQLSLRRTAAPRP
jgi:hypothetical protein